MLSATFLHASLFLGAERLVVLWGIHERSDHRICAHVEQPEGLLGLLLAQRLDPLAQLLFRGHRIRTVARAAHRGHGRSVATLVATSAPSNPSSASINLAICTHQTAEYPSTT